MISVKCDPTMRRFERIPLVKRAVYDSSSKDFMLHSPSAWRFDCYSAASPQTSDGHGGEAGPFCRKYTSCSSPKFCAPFHDLTEKATLEMASYILVDAERKAEEPIATCPGLQLPALPRNLDAPKGLDISILDGAFQDFQSSPENDPLLPSDGTRSAGTGDSWWMDSNDRLPLGELDIAFGVRRSEGQSHSSCFNLTSDLANPEGVSDSSFTAWDYSRDGSLDSLIPAAERDDRADLAAPSIGNCSTPCISEPRSETFHFKLYVDRGETQDLGSIMGWEPIRSTHGGIHNVEAFRDLNAQDPTCNRRSNSRIAELEPTEHERLHRGTEGPFGNDHQKIHNDLAYPTQHELDIKCEEVFSRDGKRGSLGGSEEKELSEGSIQSGEQHGSLVGSTTCSLSQSCDEEKEDSGFGGGAVRWASTQEDCDRPPGAKTTQKPPTTVGISLEHLKDVFHLHRPEAERKLNLKRTTFSNLSRHFGISKWPFRTLRDADKRLKHNHALLRKPSTSREKRRKLEAQQRRLRAVKELMYAEPHQSKDSNTLSVLLTLVEEREHAEGMRGSCGF